jgi:hypothetical protein
MEAQDPSVFRDSIGGSQAAMMQVKAKLRRDP